MVKNFSVKLTLNLLLSLALGLMCSCSSFVKLSSANKITYPEFRSEHKSFQTSEGSLKYIDKGRRDGEVIVLLHGVPTSGWLYRHMIDDLTDSGYRVIVPDVLGFGASDNPDGYTIYNEKNHAKRLLSLMDGLGVRKWHHVCHDAGGLWTQALVDKSSSRLKSLTILNSVLLEKGFAPPMRMEPGLIAKASMTTYRSQVTNGIMTNLLFNEGLEDCRDLTEVDKAGYRQPLIEGRTKSLYYFYTQTCNDLPNYKKALSKLRNSGCPVQVIWGEKDRMLLWEPQASEVMQLLGIKASNVHLLKANHFLQEEQPEKVNSLIKSFISGKEVVK